MWAWNLEEAKFIDFNIKLKLNMIDIKYSYYSG